MSGKPQALSLNEERRFRDIWSLHNGSVRAIQPILHIGHTRIRRIARELGLRPYPYISIREAARLAQCSPSEMHRRLTNGEIIAQRQGKKWLITEQSVREPVTAREPPGLSLQEAAPYLGYTISGLRARCQRGLTPAVKWPRRGGYEWRVILPVLPRDP